MSVRVYSELVQRALLRYPDKPAMHIKREGKYKSWTYKDYKQDLNRLVSALKKTGFSDTSNAIVIGQNTPEWTIAYHAIFLAGCCTVPVDPNIPVDEIEEIVKVTEAEIVFCSESYISKFKKIKEDHQFLKKIICFDRNTTDDIETYNSFIETGNPAEDAFERTFDPDDAMAILFTSGTTGRSKGAVLTQKNYCIPSEDAYPLMDLSTVDTVIAVLPLYHVFGFAACIAACLNNGIDVVFIPEIKGPLIVEAMNDKKISIFPAVPQMLTLFHDSIMRNVEEKGPFVQLIFSLLFFISKTFGTFLGREFRAKLFSTVHKGFGGHFNKIVSGGASLDKKTFHAFKLMGFDIVEGYGLTETFGPITLCPISKQVQGSVGPVLSTNEVRVANPDSSGNGEIQFKGDSIFKGYHKNPDANRNVFTDDGWFKTGDIGNIDKRGFIFLSGRIKEMIVLDSGKNVYPDELEDYYLSSSVIDEIGILGTTFEGSNKVSAVIVPSKELITKYSLQDLDELITNEMQKLGKNRPDYKKVSRYVISRAPLPRTSTKKIKKHELKEIFQDISGNSIRSKRKRTVLLTAMDEMIMSGSEFKAIKSIIIPMIKDKNYDLSKITPTTNIYTDLGLDSLRFLDLISTIEQQLTVSIPEHDLLKIETLHDLHTSVITAAESGIQRENIRTRIKEESDLDIKLKDRCTVLSKLLISSATGLSTFLWGLKVKGFENTPKDRPVIFASNHQSLADSVWILSVLPKSVRRKTYILGKVEITKVPLLAKLLKGINFIPVERAGDIISPLKASFMILKEKKNLFLFPEGTRSLSDEIGSFRSGIGMLMKETEAEVVPIRIINSGKKWPKGKLPKLFSGKKDGPKVIFGTPTTFNKMVKEGRLSSNADDSRIASALREIIENLR